MRPSLRWALLLCLAAFAAQAEDNTKAKLSAVKTNLESTKKDEAALAAQIEENKQHMGTLRDRSKNLAESLQATERRVDESEDNTDKLNAELATKQKEFDARRQQYAQTVVSLLRMHRIPPTAVFAEPENVHPLMRTASLLEKTNAAIAHRAHELKDQMDDLTRLKTRATTSAARLQKEKTSLAAQQETLRKELAARQEAQEKLSTDHEKVTAQVAALTRQSRSLQELITKLENQPSIGRARNRHEVSENAPAKGSMRAPAVGRVLHGFGERKNANETYRGMVLATRPGGMVVAPLAGEVVFTGPFMDYGRMVLLKHGNGYISLLAGLGSIDVSLNQEVGAGEPVGNMPNSATPPLYVELRDHSKPIDPSGWFANVGHALAKG